MAPPNPSPAAPEVSPDRGSGAEAAPAPMTHPSSNAPKGSAPTRVAVVGAGFIADFHLEILKDTPGVLVVSVCDADLPRAESAARRFGVSGAVGSLSELSADEVDVAHVLVPPHLHVAVCAQLLQQGIGVLVEKPLALSSADARKLCALAAERDLPLAVNHNAVWHPAFQRLLARLNAGEIGRAEHVRVCLSVPLRQLDAGDFSHWMFRTPRNIVFEQAPHPFAQVHALLGKVVRANTTLLSTRELQPGQLFHDRWLIAAEAERGTAEVYLAFGQDFTRSTVEVLGTDGSLEADLFHDLNAGETKTLWLDFWNAFLAGWRRGGELRRSARRTLKNYLAFTLGLAQREDAFFAGMRGSIRAFHAALRAGETLPAQAEIGAEVLDWCEAATAEVSDAEVTAEDLFTKEPARDGELVVLGGTGFIGSRVVDRLLERGVPVTAVVRRAHSLPPKILEAAKDGRVRLVRASLEDTDALREAVKGAKCVVQLATGGGATWEVIERSMVGGSLAVGEACLEHAVERMVYVSSTAALYLGADAGPEVSDAVGPDPQPDVRALYGKGKIAAERALAGLQREKRLPLVIVRPAVVLGEGTALQHSGLGLWVRDNHCVGWGAGDTPLPLVLVDDVADALVAAALHEGDELHGKALNLAADTGLTAREVVAEMRRATGRDLHFHPRSLVKSQVMEIGKWIVKKVGRRPGVLFPSWRDLKSRAMVPKLSCDLARGALGWKPVEDRERFLDLAVRVHAPQPRGQRD
jgi:predicted dehydrogenase/nucleoside-diphosphate-sugar epimerase